MSGVFRVFCHFCEFSDDIANFMHTIVLSQLELLNF